MSEHIGDSREIDRLTAGSISVERRVPNSDVGTDLIEDGARLNRVSRSRELNVNSPPDHIPRVTDVAKLVRPGRRVAVRFRRTSAADQAIGIGEDNVTRP